MFAFGLLLQEIVTGTDAVRRGQTIQGDALLQGQCPRNVAALIASCVSMTPGERPTAAQAVRVIERSLAEDAVAGR